MSARWAQIRHVEASFPVGDMSEKRNVGCRQSRAELVAFVDDDVVVAPDWARLVMEAFRGDGIGLVSGPSLVPDDLSLFPRLAGLTLASKAAGYVAGRYTRQSGGAREADWSLVIGCNMSYRRDVLEKIGGFDPAFGPGDDLLASLKVHREGFRSIFHADAYLYHYPRSSLRGFWRQVWGYGAVRVRLIRRGVPTELTPLVPGLWVASLAVLGLGAFLSPVLMWLLAADVALYLLAAAWITMDKCKETRKPADALMFFLVPVMHLSYGLAEWAELLRPNKDLSEKSGAAR
jgi:GT2 family glycosyltransferase